MTDENLADHLPVIYMNRPLGLWGTDDSNVPSTISQPGLVLRMLDMLQLQAGQRVFELGAGSGWNAALMGHIVGPTGHVYSTEIIPEVAEIASENITAHKVENVTIVMQDGGSGYLAGGPFDRVVFTAGTYDLPRHFYTQTKEGGLLLVVIKNQGGGDNLFLFKKMGDHFESLDSLHCGFVPLVGQYAIPDLEPICLEDIPDWKEIERQLIANRPFWWGGKGKESFGWRTLGVRSYLAITQPLFKAFVGKKTDGDPQPEHYFGLWNRAANSLVLARETGLISYGSTDATDQLVSDLRAWVDIGMPSATSFALSVYPSDMQLPVGLGEWITKHKESQFVWSLPNRHIAPEAGVGQLQVHLKSPKP